MITIYTRQVVNLTSNIKPTQIYSRKTSSMNWASLTERMPESMLPRSWNLLNFQQSCQGNTGNSPRSCLGPRHCWRVQQNIPGERHPMMKGFSASDVGQQKPFKGELLGDWVRVLMKVRGMFMAFSPPRHTDLQYQFSCFKALRKIWMFYQYAVFTKIESEFLWSITNNTKHIPNTCRRNRGSTAFGLCTHLNSEILITTQPVIQTSRRTSSFHVCLFFDTYIYSAIVCDPFILSA